MYGMKGMSQSGFLGAPQYVWHEGNEPDWGENVPKCMKDITPHQMVRYDHTSPSVEV